MTQNECYKWTIDLLNSLEDEIKIVIDAAVPNKQQNRATQKMASDYFWEARNAALTIMGPRDTNDLAAS
jgi:hypothetical protein